MLILIANELEHAEIGIAWLQIDAVVHITRATFRPDDVESRVNDKDQESGVHPKKFLLSGKKKN